MKLIYLTEEESITEKSKNAAALIFKDCQPWLREMNKAILYRGYGRDYGGDGEMIVKKSVRLDGRKSKFGLDPNVIKQMNKALKDSLGQPYRDSIMCTGNYLASKRFGLTHVVFPIGEYKYAFSPSVNDWNLTDDHTEILKKFKSTPQLASTEDLYNHYMKFIKDNNYKTSGLKEYLQSKTDCEVMVRCKEAYVVKYSTFIHPINMKKYKEQM